MNYSIIIPVFNEYNYIPKLLFELKKYSLKNEIIIVDDGSTDGTSELLIKSQYIRLITLKENQGKANAIKKGIESSRHEKIILFDGDLEIHPMELKKLMELNKAENILSIFGNRFYSVQPLYKFWYLGNLFFTKLFNYIFRTKLNDVLCCAKSFYRQNLNIEELSSNGFDIDIEIAAKLSAQSNIYEVNLNYFRRSKNEGKKLNFFDSAIILNRIIIIFINYSLLAPLKRILENAFRK